MSEEEQEKKKQEMWNQGMSQLMQINDHLDGTRRMDIEAERAVAFIGIDFLQEALAHLPWETDPALCAFLDAQGQRLARHLRGELYLLIPPAMMEGLRIVGAQARKFHLEALRE